MCCLPVEHEIYPCCDTNLKTFLEKLCQFSKVHDMDVWLQIFEVQKCEYYVITIFTQFVLKVEQITLYTEGVVVESGIIIFIVCSSIKIVKLVVRIMFFLWKKVFVILQSLVIQ